MTLYPCAKINLGLNIVGRREDGYHNLETVFYPIPLCDTLSVAVKAEDVPSDFPCELKITGNAIDCNEQDNLVVKAYNLLAKDFALPRIKACLHKQIPSQAGLGGGSSDATYMLRLLNEQFELNISTAQLQQYSARLGADCAFFITAKPSFATGIGEILSPLETVENQLKGLHLLLVKPETSITTKEAFAHIVPQKPKKSCREVVGQPIETWKEELTNDFENSVFAQHPELAEIKTSLYRLGAVYAQMSGSGSTVFGFFNSPLHEEETRRLFPNCFTSQTVVGADRRDAPSQKDSH